MKKLLILLCLICFTACDIPENAEKKQAKRTKQMLLEADKQIGMPDIVNWTERKFAKQILELRDKEIMTHTYIVNNLKGCLVYVGQSIGYGLPYAVQFTNPEKIMRNSMDSYGTLPQADPNGLYMPDSLSATWVLLYNPETKKASPVYLEPEIVVSPFRIKNNECK